MQARSLFLPAQKWINAAKEYYVIDGFVSDHIELVKVRKTKQKLQLDLKITAHCMEL